MTIATRPAAPRDAAASSAAVGAAPAAASAAPMAAESLGLIEHVRACRRAATFRPGTTVLGWLLFLTAVVATAADVASTVSGLSNPGAGVGEGNPAAAGLMNVVGLPGWAVFTLLWGTFLGFMSLARPRTPAGVVVVSFALVLLAVRVTTVMNNISVLS